MNVGELKKELEKYPDNMDVWIEQHESTYRYSMSEITEKRDINLYDGFQKIDNIPVIIIADHKSK